MPTSRTIFQRPSLISFGDMQGFQK